MHHEKKTSMEDTWSAAELKRLLSRRKQPERDRRQHRGGESVERRHRDSRGDRDHRDRHGERRDSHTEERRGEQHRRTERERLEDADRRARDSREDRDKRDRGGPKEGHDGEWDTIKKKEKERRREERERRRHEERREDRDRRERHEDRKLSRDEREQYRKEKEDRERRRKERADHDEKPRRAREDGAEEERAERERRKERRRREDDFETHHGSSRESKGGHRHDTRTTKAEEDVMRSGNMAAKGAGDAQDPVAKDEPSHEYEDDFEDYEEDFEELDEDGDAEVGEDVKAIQRAMGEENERVRTSVSALSKEEEEEEKPERSRAKPSDEKASRSSQRGRFIDFVAAKRREVSKKVAMKQKKRSAELLRLIDLDFSTTFSLLELPPVSEYDMYIRNFGAANTKQAYVQCNEENADRDVQTEEVELSDKWTQHPAERSGACGDPNQSHESGNMSGMNFDSRRLTKFLCAASQVMSVLLEEDHAERSSSQGRTAQKDALSFSDGSLQLHTALPFLRGRAVSQVLFSQVQRHKLLSVHEASSSTGDVTPHHGCAVICVWNMWEPSTPQKILLCESEVQCCCFSPGKATLVFAGTRDGSVALWDLREPDGNHHRLKVGGDEWTFRRPTFSTDAVPSAHFSAVTSVEVVPASVSGGPGSEAVFLASEEELLGLSFQLASMDENGLLNLWVVVQLPKGNEAGSQTDLGLRPGGKVKLLHSSACVTAKRVSPSHADKTGPPQSLHVKFLPTDPSHFFLGTNMGLVSHGTTQGLKALPKCYSSRQFATRLVDVTAIQFSPFRPHLFLVGCSDGTVRLHEVSRDKPAAEWTDGTAGKEVVSVQWSQTRPAVFCVLDAASRLHIWDLLKSDAAPVVTEEMDTDRLTAVAAFGDAGQQNTYSGIATAHRSGKIEMHYFTREFTMQKAHEENALEAKVVESF